MRFLGEDHGYGEALEGNIPSDHMPDQSGEWQIRGGVDDEGQYPKWMHFGCPRRPGHGCLVPIKPQRGPNNEGWDLAGTNTEPTLTPSIHCLSEYEGRPSAGCGWHGYITKGQFTNAA